MPEGSEIPVVCAFRPKKCTNRPVVESFRADLQSRNMEFATAEDAATTLMRLRHNTKAQLRFQESIG
jgi:hypothetical protein